MKILCIIPIYNEGARLDYLLKEIALFKKNTDLNIDFLMINNGSTDNSENILNLHKFESVKIKKNKGVGYALLLGLRLAHKNNYEVLVHMAGNYKMSPFDIPNVLNPIKLEDIDYVSGTRFLDKNNFNNNPTFRKISIKLLSIFFSFLFNKRITDATCGFRAFKIKKVIKYFKFFNKKKYFTYGYEYYSYGKILLSQKIKTCEASVKMNYPKAGSYSKIRPFIDWYPIIFGYLEALMDRKKLD
tara:strand:+ start:4138 stop:4866 length:729 start_codon:yes stop_codon:yes gene_type:complete